MVLEGLTKSVLLFLRDFLLGGLAGIIAKTATAPLDRIKLVLQVQDASKQMIYHNNQKYEGIRDCTRRIFKEQGLASFWRGNLASVLRYFPLQAINLSCKDRYKQYFLRGVDKEKNFWHFFAGNMISGAATGATSCIVVHPLDFARTRLGADVGCVAEEREFHGICDCLKRIYKSDGLTGLYRGFWVSVIGSAIYRSIHFGLYDTAKGLVGQDTFFLSWLFSQGAVLVATLFSYPFDTVRRRLMMQSGYNESEVIYTSTWHCFVSIVRHEGCSAFFKGAPASALRCVSTALVVVVYDTLQNHLQDLQSE